MSGKPHASPGLLALVREDWNRHGRKWSSLGFHAVGVYRLGAWHESLPPLLRVPVWILYSVLRIAVTNVYGVSLPRTARLGRRLLITNGGGVVLADGAEVGDDCVIHQNVTIGISRKGTAPPRIGSNVEIAVGATVIGSVTIGDGVMIGPNALVVTDVPAGATAFAPTARIIREPTGEGARPEAARETSRTSGDMVDVSAGDDRALEGLIALIRSSLSLAYDVDADTPLMSTGIVDSFNAVVLVQALEEAYAVAIPTEEIDVDTWDTPRDILSFLRDHSVQTRP